MFGHQPGEVAFADGSTRARGELAQRYGVAFLIDTGLSSAVDYSTGALLRVSGTGTSTRALVVRADGSESVLWQATP